MLFAMCQLKSVLL